MAQNDWRMLCILEQPGRDEPRHLMGEKQAQRGAMEAHRVSDEVGTL